MGHLITVRTFNSMYLRAIKKLSAQKTKDKVFGFNQINAGYNQLFYLNY